MRHGRDRCGPRQQRTQACTLPIRLGQNDRDGCLQTLTGPRGDRGEIRIAYQQPRARILQLIGDFRGGEPPIQRRDGDPTADGAKQHREKAVAVAPKVGDAVSGLESVSSQQTGCRIGSLVEFRIGHLLRPVREQDRNSVRALPGTQCRDIADPDQLTEPLKWRSINMRCGRLWHYGPLTSRPPDATPHSSDARKSLA